MLSTKKEITKQIDQLREKISRQDAAIVQYREQLKKLSTYKAERDLYSDLSNALAGAEGFDDLFRKCLDVLSRHLKAGYYGVFWLDYTGDAFYYRDGKGYKSGLMPAIPVAGSLMGECIIDRQVLWVSDLAAKPAHIPLNQEPRERNVICAPIVLNGTDAGVFRLANIDPDTVQLGRRMLRTVIPLLWSSLERLYYQEQSERTRRGLETAFTVSRMLENTLSEKEILQKVCAEIPRLFACKACMISLRGEDGVYKPSLVWPAEFHFSTNPKSGGIYLRNLFEKHPSGSALIQDLRLDRKWSWPNMKVKSLVMAPITVRKHIHGSIIAVSPCNETFDYSQVNLLKLCAAQTSMTLERAAYFRRQEDLARCDGLTGLLNHRMFQERLREEIHRTKRYRRTLSLIMMDIDHFKMFNDNYGHPVGDEVLKMVSLTLKGMIRNTDSAFRYGGEEFAILLPETTDENAVNLAERLRRRVEMNRAVKGLSVTVSLGVAGIRDNEPPEDFIKRADQALYAAKRNGRNRIVVG